MRKPTPASPVLTASGPAAFLKAERRQAGNLVGTAVALGTLGGVLLIAQAACLALAVDAVVIGGQGVADILPWLGGVLGLLLARSLTAYLAEQVAVEAAIRIKTSLRRRLFEHLQALGPTYLAGERSGALATTLVDGVEALEAYFARYLPAMSLATLVPLSILALVLPLDWRSALVFLVTAPLIPLFMILVGRGAERINQAHWQQLQRMGGHFLDTVQGLTTLKLFNASRREAEVIARISEEYRHATMKVLRVAFLSSLALEFFATLSIALVAVLIGFRLLYGQMDFLTGFLVLLLAPEFYLPLRSLGSHYHARLAAVGAAEGMVAILAQPLPTPPSARRVTPPSPPFRIRGSDLHFRYAPDRPVLRGIDFAIQPGEHLALVGPSGAGKSTLANLLLGFIRPERGSLSINDVPLELIDLDAWRRQVAWVPQRPRLFHGSIRDNLCLGLRPVDEERLRFACEQAQVDEFLDRLPDGLDTLIGEGGRALSGGQVQRLALARAFLRDAHLLILDEATANLDSASEGLVQTAIGQLRRDRSLLTIAHRLATVRCADRILVMDEGLIVQEGRHEQLALEPGWYRRLLREDLPA